MTFSQLKLKPSARVRIVQEAWYGDRASDVTRLVDLLGARPLGVGIQEVEAEGVRGRVYICLLSSPAPAPTLATPTLSYLAAGYATVILEAENLPAFHAALRVRVGNRLREAGFGSLSIEEDEISSDPLPSLLPTLG